MVRLKIFDGLKINNRLGNNVIEKLGAVVGLSNYLLPCLSRFFKKSVNYVIIDNFSSQIVFIMIFVEILGQASFYSKQTKIQYPLKVYILKEVF